MPKSDYPRLGQTPAIYAVKDKLNCSLPWVYVWIQEDIDTFETIVKLDNKFIGAKYLLGIIAYNIG